MNDVTGGNEDTGDAVGELRVERDGAVATLWLDRPAKRNAVTFEMWQGIAAMCTAFADDDDVRVVIVRGAGEHFCAGADIGDLADVDADEYGAANEAADEALARLPKPTIAFVTGACVGGGAELAMACDLRIADTTARFGITPARLGIVYPAYALERAVRQVGASAVKYLLFSGELIDAPHAVRIGLVDELHRPDEAERRLGELTAVLVQRSALTQQASKEMVDAVTASGSLDRAIALRWAAEAARSGERAEGLAAFLERRPPAFSWRSPRRRPD